MLAFLSRPKRRTERQRERERSLDNGGSAPEPPEGVVALRMDRRAEDGLPR
jgi:hypothetical protein